MPEYLAPGVFVEETSFRSRSIEGVGTSTTAFIGATRKGPLYLPTGATVPTDGPVILDGNPEVVTSFREFERIYGSAANMQEAGGAEATNFLAHSVQAFFANGGTRLYVARTFTPAAPDNDGRASSAAIPAAGNDVFFRARVPGSALNGRVVIRERRVPASARALDTAPNGSFMVVGADGAAQAARLEASRGPAFSVGDGQRLVLTINGAADQDITFNGSAAEVTGSDDLATPTSLSSSTFTVTVGGLTQDINLPDGDYSRPALVAAINERIRGGYARLDGDRLAIGSDIRGTGGSVSVTANADFGFAANADAAGGGNVADLAAVTVAELNALFAAAARPVTAVVSNDVLVITTNATGAAATLQVQAEADSAHAAFGLGTDAVAGVDGSTPTYYLKNGSGTWVDAGDVALGAIPAGTQLVSISVEAIDADGGAQVYQDLGLSALHPRFVGSVLAREPGQRAQAIAAPYAVEIPGAVTAFSLHAALLSGQNSVTIPLSGGNDGLGTVASSPDASTLAADDALAVLEQVEDISIIAAPGHSALGDTVYRAIQSQLIGHAERQRYRIAVLDTPPALTPGQAREHRGRFDSSYAALYYPWVVVANPLARPGNDQIPRELALPPSGFLCGIYARNDATRGVWKAPANETIRGALRFETAINTPVQETLNPDGVNCLRALSGRGMRVWGARTSSSDPEWTYVNIRRYFIYLERSIDTSTQWAVFEPNGEALWANIRETVASFLYAEWRSGALLGSRPDDAFFVRCDRSTMSQADLDNGRLICEIGVAALKPAEFVIFRIGQKTVDA